MQKTLENECIDYRRIIYFGSWSRVFVLRGSLLAVVIITKGIKEIRDHELRTQLTLRQLARMEGIFLCLLSSVFSDFQVHRIAACGPSLNSPFPLYSFFLFHQANISHTPLAIFQVPSEPHSLHPSSRSLLQSPSSLQLSLEPT